MADSGAVMMLNLMADDHNAEKNTTKKGLQLQVVPAVSGW